MNIFRRSRQIRRPPAYYDRVAAEASARWNQLERDPILAAPWHQLFKQLRSNPDHVISELLQNADDAQASWARVSLQDDLFCFEHDGKDFDEKDLESLCRFGYSRKRTLHTIGYRGIGFKTLFSLSDRVELLTPTLTIAFEAERFTQPIWLKTAEPTQHTVIRLRISSPEKIERMQRHIGAWAASPVPLLFFHHIRKLQLGDSQIQKEIIGPGPVAHSQRVRLIGKTTLDALHLWSAEEPLPTDAVAEVHEERGSIMDDLPPVRVEIVHLSSREHRLFAVLPTTVEIRTPFAGNAPFIQDPARTGVKSPSVSPTNRWLLTRIGKLAGAAFVEWVNNQALNLSERAEAYQVLLPASPTSNGDTLNDECSNYILEAFQRVVDGEKFLIATDGLTYAKHACSNIPKDLLSVWQPEQLIELFASDAEAVLAPEIRPTERDRLIQWKWLERFNPDRMLEVLTSADIKPPRPADFEAWTKLWEFIYDRFDRRWNFNSLLRKLTIFPVEGSDVLYPSTEIMFSHREGQSLSEEDWDFLAQYLYLADRKWFNRLCDVFANGDYRKSRILRDLNEVFRERQDLGAIVEQAARKIFEPADPGQAGIRLAYIAAKADITAPDALKFLCQDNCWRPVTAGLLYITEPQAWQCLPDTWLSQHHISARYDTSPNMEDRRAWRAWASSDKSRLLPFPIPTRKPKFIYRRHDLEECIRQRGGILPKEYQLKRENYCWIDYDFDSELLKFWKMRAEEEPQIWSDVVLCIARAWSTIWSKVAYVNVEERGTSRQYPLDVGRATAQWLFRLQNTPCLPDRYGTLHLPGTIYRLTPETEHLVEVEPFLDKRFDQPEFHPFLNLLGVRTKPLDILNLIERLRGLAKSENQVSSTILVNIYRAVDRSVPHLPREYLQELREVFAREALIVSIQGTWHTSKAIFQKSLEGLDVPIILPELRDLKLWDDLGVSREPTIELLVEWLETFQVDGPLPEPERRRIRGILARAPEQVWTKVRYWLSCDNHWIPVDAFQWSSATKANGYRLYPSTLRATADLSMLAESVRSQHPFADLPRLERVITFRISRTEQIDRPFQPTWVQALAQCILRTHISGESPGEGHDEQIEETRNAARRLYFTRFQQVAFLKVLPYIEAQPVGPEQAPQALWEKQTFYIVGSPAEIYESIVRELTKAFPHPDIREAIRDCIDRDPEWIERYFENHFKLGAVDSIPINLDDRSIALDERLDVDDFHSPPADLPVDITPIEESPKVFTDEEANPLDSATSEQRTRDTKSHARKSRLDELLHAYWISRGFDCVEPYQKYISDKGIIERLPEGNLFRWRLISLQGTILCSYWVQRGNLEEGIEMPAEIWHFITEQPDSTAILLVSLTGHIEQYSGTALLAMSKAERLQIYPAVYRLRRNIS